ncbi:hypothetical protein M422DRAFT_254719 [Sphaerobolus stellatus SS14]|uniref:Uncharacterized protein n=1 Tax=Sphaerobolus stellatus (strain SS14) TaxID=990650 RepID=A0A0C9UGY2_SPHS4|nr:hypothetical protein M422DRAFT_254719 [Sphaerobolus stellatus SS14]
MSARKLFSCLQLPRHASPALGNAMRQVHAVFGPVEGGIDVKNGSSSFESDNVFATSRDVTLSDVESHPPDARPINSRAGQRQSHRNPTFITWLLLGVSFFDVPRCILIPILKMRRTHSSTHPMISSLRFTTATLQRASTMVLTTLAFVHASTPSFLPGSNSSTSTLSQPLPKDHRRRRYLTSVLQHRAPPP